MRSLRRRGAGVGMLLLSLAGCGDPLVVAGDVPGYMRVLVGTLDAIGERADTLASRTLLTDPGAVFFAEDEARLYVVDRGSRRVQNGITQRVGRVLGIDSRGRLEVLHDAGRCTPALCLHSAAQLALAPDGALVLADPVGGRVLRFDPSTRSLDVLAGNGSDAFTPDGAPAVTAALHRPNGIAIGEDGTVYFTEEGSGRVRSIDAAGMLRTVAGSEPGYGGDGGPALDARLRQPANLAQRGGLLYIADAGNHRVRVVALASGAIRTLAGTGGAGFSGDGGSAEAAQLATPTGLALDAAGELLFITERDNHRLRAVHLPGGTIQTLAGTGDPRSNGSRGPAGSLSLRWPAGVATAARGVVYLADTGHFVVWRATLRL